MIDRVYGTFRGLLAVVMILAFTACQLPTEESGDSQGGVSRFLGATNPNPIYECDFCIDCPPECEDEDPPPPPPDPADTPLSVGVNGPSLVSPDWTNPYNAQYTTSASNGRTTQYFFYWYVSRCSGPTDLYCWTSHPYELYQSGLELRTITVPIPHDLRVVRVKVEARENRLPNYRSGQSAIFRTRAPGFSMGGGGGGVELNCLGNKVFDWYVTPDSLRHYKRNYCTGLKVWETP